VGRPVHVSSSYHGQICLLGWLFQDPGCFFNQSGGARGIDTAKFESIMQSVWYLRAVHLFIDSSADVSLSDKFIEVMTLTYVVVGVKFPGSSFPAQKSKTEERYNLMYNA
jgi:hypothetical protein